MSFSAQRTAHIPLRRLFLIWEEEAKTNDPDLLHFYQATGRALEWSALLEKHRVVVLAEAGSGKSAELEEQANLSRAVGRFTFGATVQSVGAKGLGAALGRASMSQLAAWRKSDRPAWFFFDS